VRSRRKALIGLIAAVVVAGCGGGDDDEQSADLPEGCAEVEAPAPREGSASRSTERLTAPTTAVVTTSCGVFEIELDVDRAPKTTGSFAGLVEQGFYDGLGIPRIDRGYVIQTGDPKGDQTGGPGYFVDEPPPPNLSYTRGTVAMAKTAAEPPGRSGSQFFVVTAADAGLSPDYALLGKVTKGFEVVQRIEELGGPEGKPTAPVVVESITLKED
jgi:cyclophilin family peptidyl-prolyl cis-trans isomerase